MIKRVYDILTNLGIPVYRIYSGMQQKQRIKHLNSFQKQPNAMLLATDVAARGIDVDDVEAVINFDLPAENEYYLHRIGRTGRAHKHGVSFTLDTNQESVRMDEILKYKIAKPLPLHFEDGILRNEDGTPFFDNI